MLRRNRVQIDLDAIRSNYRLLKSSLHSQTEIMPVIKADAYGHGMVKTALALLKEGASHFAVATPDEGVILRENGITEAEILVLGATVPGAAAECIRYGVTQTVFTPEMVWLLQQEAQRQGRLARVHIKLDTGMNRIGLRTMEEAGALAEALREAPMVQTAGIYTHFADAEHCMAPGKTFAQKQMESFCMLRSCFDPAIPVHCANSAMTLLAPEAHFDMVRTGIALYGYPPVACVLPLRPALSWLTEVTHVKEIEAGESIGYGCTFTAARRMRVATIAVGYGDGYHRALSSCGQALIGGRRVPIVGRVCMDQTMVDVTDAGHVSVGDEVVLIGRQEHEYIGAEEVAGWADTISYEVLTSILPRVHRIYVNE